LLDKSKAADRPAGPAPTTRTSHFIDM
jgi:hypothetical protein